MASTLCHDELRGSQCWVKVARMKEHGVVFWSCNGGVLAEDSGSGGFSGGLLLARK